jgi:hypothetical protein
MGSKQHEVGDTQVQTKAPWKNTITQPNTPDTPPALPRPALTTTHQTFGLSHTYPLACEAVMEQDLPQLHNRCCSIHRRRQA